MKSKPLYLFIFSACFLQPILSAAQSILFNFDNAPVYTPLPISQTVNGITAHFSATGQGYSIQSVSTATVVPVGFTGNFIFPSSINASDLLIRFDQTLTDFSIWYSPQELACDTSATMRVTAYMKGSYVGTDTKVAANPGTWPVDSVSCSFTQGFDSVVVHFDSHPSMCQDWGPIFIADNMRITVLKGTGFQNSEMWMQNLVIVPNPVSQAATISFSLQKTERMKVSIYGLTGRLVKNIFEGSLSAGAQQISFNINDDALQSGAYVMQLAGNSFSQSYKLVVTK